MQASRGLQSAGADAVIRLADGSVKLIEYKIRYQPAHKDKAREKGSVSTFQSPFLGGFVSVFDLSQRSAKPTRKMRRFVLPLGEPGFVVDKLAIRSDAIRALRLLADDVEVKKALEHGSARQLTLNI